ncbi:hypothetical protein IEN85_22585 [Pelagicoccus sp. NFK12]|uniref:Uncharacterized protein n=1 Tax=Pelagicoccus enzymogenes TaxID=2773457 RepID=A0A927FCG3_9BACT|nr:hypothetical protein [Pelagicoccus enzymogenes]MBD5782304.1 hypothetical protein [Pelagicoccus enzymogenes]MDQ8199219.1 hypothetical protein [Pelagicoccus enzymogenes]
MVRLSSPISSRLILAGSYAVIGGIGVYCVFWLLYGEAPRDEVSSFLYQAPDHTAFDDVLKFMNALGPPFGILAFTIPFFPFTFLYASFVCPSRITVTDTEIRTKSFGSERRWHMSELQSVTFKEAGNSQFIIFKIGGKTLKAEIEHGRWGAIRDLLPAGITNPVEQSTSRQVRHALPRQPAVSIPDSLSYVSIDKFEADYRSEIYEQAAQMAGAFEWWNEPLWLFDRISDPDRLTGQSRLFRPDPVDQDEIHIIGREIPLQENALMCFIDAERIIGLLQALSEEHEITWTVSENEGRDEIGTIHEGAVPHEIYQWLNRIRDSWTLTQAEIENHALHERIRQKHTDSRLAPLNQEDSQPLPSEKEAGT